VLSRKGDSAPGRLRHRLTLETATSTPDGAGGATLSWNTVASLWAEIVPLKTDEREVAEGLGDVTLHRITIRKRDDISAGDRFTLGARVFRIKSMTDAQEDGRYFACVCEEEGAS